MKPLAVSRMFRSAVIAAIDRMPTDPHTMAAVDLLSEGFRDGTPGLLEYLWKYSDGVNWGSLVGCEYSPKKQQAVFIVTGKRWEQWSALSFDGGKA